MGYNSYTIDNLQLVHKSGELEVLEALGVDEAHITKVHSENLQKQRFLWKLHYHNTVTWTFF